MTVVVDGTLAQFQMGRSVNWFHWLLQVLPRVKQLVDSGEKFDALHAPGMSSSQRESLDLALAALGVMVPVYEDSEITAANVIQAPAHAWEPSDGSPPPRWIIHFLRRLYRPKLRKPRSFFVSRRGFEGYDESEGIEQLLGFLIPTLYPAEMCFREQVDAFASADLIFCPHGSGLTNIVFCKPGTRIVEIVPPDYHTGVFAKLAYAAGCFYTRIEAVPGRGR